MAVTLAELQEQVGQEVVSDWLLVDQARVNLFAEATGDHQFIHVDPELAAQTPFGGPIAHGFLTLSLLPVLHSMAPVPPVPGMKMAVNYGGNRVRFLSPVRVGKRVRGRFKTLELVEKRPGQFQRTEEFTVEIEGEGKPALIADWITQFFL
jgi:acyl dehydratase